MNFDERLSLYLEGEMLTEEDVSTIHRVIDMFHDDYGLELTEENAGMFIAHLCAALNRNVTKEEIPPVEETMLKELAGLDTYQKSLEILDRLVAVTNNCLNETEQDYALLHINNLLATVER
ncbi:MAG: PRD domain-containing protein [Erysipelotrichia bacterium]|nr:PRD domain-containing protein [Erysipelotrichia bacterium]